MIQKEEFPHGWSVEVLVRPPLIAPVRQYTYPMQIAGEEDALARGALLLLVRPAPGQAPFLATCALGFRNPTMPTGVYSTPKPTGLCAVAGGYAYLINCEEPTSSIQVGLKPVTAVLPLPEHNLLLFSGFHAIHAYGPDGLAWTTGRLSWDGIRLGGVVDGRLEGTGWNMLTDREVPFFVELATGTHVGGGFEGR